MFDIKLSWLVIYVVVFNSSWDVVNKLTKVGLEFVSFWSILSEFSSKASERLETELSPKRLGMSNMHPIMGGDKM